MYLLLQLCYKLQYRGLQLQWNGWSGEHSVLMTVIRGRVATGWGSVMSVSWHVASCRSKRDRLRSCNAMVARVIYTNCNWIELMNISHIFISFTYSSLLAFCCCTHQSTVESKLAKSATKLTPDKWQKSCCSSVIIVPATQTETHDG